MTRGSILHAWFERIGWLEDGPSDDAELMRIAAKLATPEIDLADGDQAVSRDARPTGCQGGAIAERVLMIRRHSVSLALSMPILSRRCSTKRLHCERSFVVRDQDDALSLAKSIA